MVSQDSVLSLHDSSYKIRVHYRFIELGFTNSVVTRTFAKIPSCYWTAYEEDAYREEEILKRFVHIWTDPRDRNLSTLLNKKCYSNVYDKLFPLERLHDKTQFLDIAIEYILGFFSIITYKPVGPHFISVSSAADIEHVDGTYYFCCSWETAYIIAKHKSTYGIECRENSDFSRFPMMYLSSNHEDALAIGDSWRGVWGDEVALVAYSVPCNIAEMHETKTFDSPNEDWSYWIAESRNGRESHLGFVLGPMSANPRDISEGAKPIAHDPPRFQLGVSEYEARDVLDTWFKAAYLFDKPVPEKEYKLIPHWSGPMCPAEYDWRSEVTYTRVRELEHEKTRSKIVQVIWQGSKKDVV
jgi:hypothetical protein